MFFLSLRFNEHMKCSEEQGIGLIWRVCTCMLLKKQKGMLSRLDRHPHNLKVRASRCVATLRDGLDSLSGQQQPDCQHGWRRFRLWFTGLWITQRAHVERIRYTATFLSYFVAKWETRVSLIYCTWTVCPFILFFFFLVFLSSCFSVYCCLTQIVRP